MKTGDINHLEVSWQHRVYYTIKSDRLKEMQIIIQWKGAQGKPHLSADELLMNFDLRGLEIFSTNSLLWTNWNWFPSLVFFSTLSY